MSSSEFTLQRHLLIFVISMGCYYNDVAYWCCVFGPVLLEKFKTQCVILEHFPIYLLSVNALKILDLCCLRFSVFIYHIVLNMRTFIFAGKSPLKKWDCSISGVVILYGYFILSAFLKKIDGAKWGSIISYATLCPSIFYLSFVTPQISPTVTANVTFKNGREGRRTRARRLNSCSNWQVNREKLWCIF